MVSNNTVPLPDIQVEGPPVQFPEYCHMRLTTDRFRMARKRTPAPEEPPSSRGRVDLRADPAWIARVERQANRKTINLSAYIRQAVTAALEADEATDPELRA